MITRRIALLILPLLSACGSQAADVVALERGLVARTLVVGAPFAEARAKLEGSGYMCHDESGRFLAENGQTVSVPAFLACSKQASGGIFCSVQTQVVVVPDDAMIGQIHFHAGNVCL